MMQKTISELPLYFQEKYITREELKEYKIIYKIQIKVKDLMVLEDLAISDRILEEDILLLKI